MNDSPTPAEIRNQLTNMVVRDLLGPAGGPEEELDQHERHVYLRYLVGMLAPQGTDVPGEELDDVATSDGNEGEEGATDTGVPHGGTYFPSSMGLSFVVDAEASEIVVEAEWGHYQKVTSATQQDNKGDPVRVWRRTPVIPSPLNLPLKNGNLAYTLHPEHEEVKLQGRIRHTDEGWVVTLFMVNQNEERSGRKPKDEAWVFQPKLKVRAPDHQPIFVQRKHTSVDFSKMDPLTREESATLDMLYRHNHEFAVGHGVAVHATAKPQAERAEQVETEWIPRFDVPQQTARTAGDDENLSGLSLDMQQLAELPTAELIANLRHIGTAYRWWIAAEQAKLNAPAESLQAHKQAALLSVSRCSRALERIQAGIDLLESNPQAERAFRFANRAMWQQRVHTLFSRAVRKQDSSFDDGSAAFDKPENRSWRLFQLAFVLLNLPSLTDLHHPDRSDETEAVADLLWFATGGGKTEAYLGLTAYILGLRRLQGEIEGRRGDHGVAVLMRYTLRLLTLQQFQRATALICACETIRRAEPDTWGETPFRLGLWVGSKTTPNTLAGAAEALLQKRNSGKPTASLGSPHQINACPWCGCDIKEKHIDVLESPGSIGRCVIYCGDDLGRCDFSAAKSANEGLPVMVVDEEIYHRPPSLLIATVDKFAQMPWKGETQMLFGKVSGECPRHGFLSPSNQESHDSHRGYKGLPGVKRQAHNFLRPPDLIIQDELHLISGPLGSMVGLYESAVDELCSWQVGGKKVRPKVVASTATIRRAPEQVKKLFVRQLDVFPPHGTDIRDSFFALQRPLEHYPGRRYLGICAFGNRYPKAIIRVYVAHMAAAQVLYENYDNLADPWMTLVGYFNSIRELAGTRRLVDDDIRARLRDADQRGLAKRRIRPPTELTSRISSSEIPNILARLEAVFDKTLEAQRAEERKAQKDPSSMVPYDVVLATNMISVGVDIERLGLMVVAGQPKNTSEYIQATSRVGRSSHSPGLVCTVFNWARPRDLSHYERFEHYHETFYKHVEALSVTPFSARALDRGLSGVMVGLLRLWDAHLNGNLDAGKLEATDPLLPEVFDYLAQRALSATDNPDVAERIRAMLEERKQEWLRRVDAQTDHRIAYQGAEGATVGLLRKTSMADWEMFTCLDSLRDVESTISLVLDQRAAGLRVDGGEQHE